MIWHVKNKRYLVILTKILMILFLSILTEHVWQVQMQRKGLAEERGIIGNYHLCLNEKTLSLVRTGTETTLIGEHRVESVEFPLSTIRRLVETEFN